MLGFAGIAVTPVSGRAQALHTEISKPPELPDAPEPIAFRREGAADPTTGNDLSLERTPERLLKDERDIAMRDVVSTKAGFNSANNTASGVLRDVFIGAPILLFGGGVGAKWEGSRDKGLLAGEAMIDAYVTSEAVKYVTLRERPRQNNSREHFFSGDSASDRSFILWAQHRGMVICRCTRR